MKERLVRSIITLTCFSVLAVCTVSAQDAHRFVVDIPFAFVLEGQTLPTGRYELGRFDPAKPNVLIVKNVDVRRLRLILTHRVERETPSTETYLLFKRLGGKFYLAEIWTKGDINGIRVPSISEPEIRREPSDSDSSVMLNIRKP